MLKLINHGWLKIVLKSLVCGMMALILLSACYRIAPCQAFIGGRRTLCYLRLHHVPVLHNGQTFTIVLPSERLFINDTNQISPNYYPYLDLIARFIRSFSTISVKVAGYTMHSEEKVKTKGKSIEEILAKTQAEAVVRYLSNRHTNARLIYAAKPNTIGPIAWSGTPIDRSLNRRIEISFQYYKDSTAWY